MSGLQLGLTGAAGTTDLLPHRHDEEAPPFVSLSDVSEIELLILRRMREVSIGEHGSQADTIVSRGGPVGQLFQ